MSGAIEIPGIIGRVHSEDNTLVSFKKHYMVAVESAVSNIEESLRAAGRSLANVVSCLDFGCGYGRVLRLLQKKLGPDKITACDVREDALEFCRMEFGVRHVPTTFDFEATDFGGTFDLIWVGSVFSHLGAGKFRSLLDVLSNLLDKGGLLVFTTLGLPNLDLLRIWPQHFGVTFPGDEELREILDRVGFCFSPYTFESTSRLFGNEYGIALCTRSYVERLADAGFADRIALKRFVDNGWETQNQDVYAFQRI